MARRSLLLLCLPPGLGHRLGNSALPGECCHTSHVAQVTPTDEEITPPKAQVPSAQAAPLSRPPPQKPFQLQLFWISRATEAHLVIYVPPSSVLSLL
jgi:hypothetical protein